MENERLEHRENHNARDDNDTKNFTTEAKGGKAKADNLTEAKGSKARADNLTTEAKGGKARTEENSNKSGAATEMINEQGGEFPRTEVKMIISQRTETGIQTSETGYEMGEQ